MHDGYVVESTFVIYNTYALACLASSMTYFVLEENILSYIRGEVVTTQANPSPTVVSGQINSTGMVYKLLRNQMSIFSKPDNLICSF
jgi:hypothetical protein